MRLTKHEKAVLSGYLKNKQFEQGSLSDQQFAAVMVSLEEKGMIKARNPLGRRWEVAMTDFGKNVLRANPDLKSSISWDDIIKVATIVAAIAAVAGLFVGCIRLLAG